MPNSSVFNFLMLCALYRMIYRNPKLFFGKNSLNVSNVKLLSNFFFNNFWVPTGQSISYFGDNCKIYNKVSVSQ